jgi:hypothetical protein
MTEKARWTAVSMAIAIFASIALGLSAAQGGQGAQGASKGVRCPEGFETMFDAGEKVLRCKREIVRWVVTGCADKSFGTYVVKAGADACAPTEIPGVGTPPGARGSRPVACAATGYQMMTDRTGQRDRCERTETQFALPLPAN